MCTRTGTVDCLRCSPIRHANNCCTSKFVIHSLERAPAVMLCTWNGERSSLGHTPWRRRRALQVRRLQRDSPECHQTEDRTPKSESEAQEAEKAADAQWKRPLREGSHLCHQMRQRRHELASDMPSHRRAHCNTTKIT